ncbi:hypothetical protein OIU78_009873 [Salix suchowensis]|nr:hypothetical protein OIU78_009873 [Salix suchowensis]
MLTKLTTHWQNSVEIPSQFYIEVVDSVARTSESLISSRTKSCTRRETGEREGSLCKGWYFGRPPHNALLSKYYPTHTDLTVKKQKAKGSKCMDGREAMSFSSGSSPYHIHRGSGFLGPGYGSQHGVSHAAPAFRSLSNPHLAAQSNPRSGSTVPAFSIEPPNVNFGQDINVAATSEVQVGEDSSTPKRNRGRPPGSGRKQQLATLGEWMNSSAGVAFSPHVISIGVGEDIVSKLLSFSQQRPRAICILSGTGTVSSVTLRQPASSESSITYEVQGSKIQTKEQAFVTFWAILRYYVCQALTWLLKMAGLTIELVV